MTVTSTDAPQWLKHDEVADKLLVFEEANGQGLMGQPYLRLRDQLLNAVYEAGLRDATAVERPAPPAPPSSRDPGVRW